MDKAFRSVPAQFIHSLWLKYMLSSPLRSYYHILKDHQGQWQLPVMFDESMRTYSPTVQKEVIPTWHPWYLGESLFTFKLLLYMYIFKEASTIADFHMAFPNIIGVSSPSHTLFSTLPSYYLSHLTLSIPVFPPHLLHTICILVSCPGTSLWSLHGFLTSCTRPKIP